MQYCTFYLNNTLFGIEISKVQEIISSQKLTSVPLVSEDIAGLINLRGQILVAIDLRKRLALKSTSQKDLSTNIVLKTSDEFVSLLVEEVRDIVETEQIPLESAPRNIKKNLLHFLEGVYLLKDKMLFILNIDKLLNFSAV